MSYHDHALWNDPLTAVAPVRHGDDFYRVAHKPVNSFDSAALSLLVLKHEYRDLPVVNVMAAYAGELLHDTEKEPHGDTGAYAANHAVPPMVVLWNAGDPAPWFSEPGTK